MAKRQANNLSNDINFLYEMGSLRYVDRTWKQFLQTDVANDSEHTFRVIWIALTIARREKVGSEEKIMKMALIHDIGESRCPDTNYVSKIYSSRDEAKAIDDMTQKTSFSQDILDLFKEYEARKTIEAKIVKDADMLDVDFEISEHEAKGNLRKEWKKHRDDIKFFTKTAKKMRAALKKSDPQMWHVNAYNNKS